MRKKHSICKHLQAFSINIFNFAFHLIKSNFKAITTWWVHLCSRKNSAIKNPFEVNVVNVSAHLTICLANGEPKRWRPYLWDKFQFKLNSHNFETARSAEVSFFQATRCFCLLAHFYIRFRVLSAAQAIEYNFKW